MIKSHFYSCCGLTLSAKKLSFYVFINFSPAYQVKTCTKPAACNSYPSVTQFANDACATYQKKNTRLAIGLTGNGKQMNHPPNRPEQACTIYCELVSQITVS